MDIKTASIRELYSDMSEKWEILSELFSKRDEKGKPRLAMFNTDYRRAGFFRNISNFWRVLHSLEFCPDDFPGKQESDLCQYIIENYITAFYSYKYHMVVMNRRRIENKDYTFAMAEEVTHSIVRVDRPLIYVNVNDVAAFNGYSDFFGLSIRSSAKSAGIAGFETDMNEFFSPLGHSHFLGREGMLRYKWALNDEISCIALFSTEKTKEEDMMEIQRRLNYLSSIAGFMLAKQYRYDIGALLREHPSLPNLDGKQVWESYCKPLLIRGKIS